MKKFILTILSLVLALMPVAFTTTQNVAYASEQTIKNNSVENKNLAYNYMAEFVQAEGNNEADYELRQQNRYNYLVSKIKAMGYTDEQLITQEVRYVNRFKNDRAESANNLIVSKKAKTKTDKYVLVTVNYDNAELLLNSIQNSDGTSSNGVGVGITLALIDTLREQNLDINVSFVFFSASEVGLKGSRYFVDQMSQENKNNLLLTINLWGVGAGDNTYLYDDEMHWQHYDYIYNVAKNNNIDINKMPADKKLIMAYEENIGLEYVHQPLLSDSAPFIAKRLPSITFFSGNYLQDGFVQSLTQGTLAGTSNDTLQKFNDTFGEKGKAKMNDMVVLVTKLVQDEMLPIAMKKSIANKPDYSFFTINNNGVQIVTGVVCGVVILIMALVYYILKKKAEKSNDPIKPLYININPYGANPNVNINVSEQQPEKHEDPFGLDDDNNDNSNSSNDNNPFDI